MDAKTDVAIFDMNGFADRDDLNAEELLALLSMLMQRQADFLAHESSFRSKEYPWPRDPLRTWSRVWEYPYAFHHLQETSGKLPGQKLRVLDYGSGVTFFPFAVANLGHDVTCADIDPICQKDITSASNIINVGSGSVSAILVADGKIPLDTESQDVVYSISVLEHIPDFSPVIDEIHRVLRPNGKLILTVDIDLRGNFELSGIQFKMLQKKLKSHFSSSFPERTVHPSCLLTTANSTFVTRSRSPLFAMKQIARDIISNGAVVKGDPRVPLFLTVFGGVFSRVP